MRVLSQRMLAVATMAMGLVPATVYAQQPTTVSGRVTSDANTPATGVTVSIPELRVGGQTDPVGQYSFTAPASATGRSVWVVARRLGYQPDSARVTLNGASVTQDFALRQSATQLTGVVVTALGIEKEKSQLGTAQQQINSEDLNVTKAMNIVQQVQGKVSGVNITGGGTPGGSTSIVIRGQNTLASNNQPLFIVDGIPVSNSNRGGSFVNGFDFGNAISDLNPEDIESFTILKGPNAAAIYGSRAQNGAVVITTKKGMATQGRMRTELSTLYTWDAPGRLPEFQNQYGQGAGGSFEYVDGAGSGDCDGCDQSWGPRLDGRLICQFNSPGAGTGSCTPTPWIAHPENVKDFFETGHTFSTTLAVSGGTDRANARMSVGVDNVDGFVPNNFFQKTTGLLSGQLQVSPKFTTNAVLQYVRNNGRNRPGTGYLNSIMEQFFWFGRQVDVADLKNWQQGSSVNGGLPGREYNWNYNYHNNPYFQQEANNIADSRDRFIVQGSARYQLTNWLNANLRSGSDIFRYNINQEFNPAYLNTTYVNSSYQGGFSFVNDYRNEHNTEVMLNANRTLMNDLEVNAMVGGNLRREYFNSTSTTTTGISVAGIYNVSNAAITPTLGQFTSRRNMNSVFGSASTTFRNFWTVEATGRNDVSSTLPKGENSYFYPSVNTSLVLTDAIPSLQNKYLSYLKLRGSWAEVGNDADPYQLATVYQGNANQFGGRPQFTLGNNLLEPNLKPEITNSTEGGIEVGFWDGRASLDMTAYAKETRNQIYLVPVSSTTGFQNKLINAGKMQNKGFEALLNVTPLEMSNGFRWDVTFNYGQNVNKVVELAPGVDRIVLGNGLFSDVRVEATKGQPYGAIWGYDIRRCDDNAVTDGMCLTSQLGAILTDGGIPVQTDTMVYLGSIQPRWTGGLSNQFAYKNFSFGALLDIRQGGKLMSYTNYVGLYSGVLKESLLGREVDFDNPGIVVNGIDINTQSPNTDNITAETYFQNLFGATGQTTYDASYVKLRELRFGYDLPQRYASRLRASAVSLALTGRNLALWTDVPNIDPEFAYSSGNFQGVEYALPGNTRSFGISVRVTP
jgi:TonB-linked SusC/RagA family outer membrane protein